MLASFLILLGTGLFSYLWFIFHSLKIEKENGLKYIYIYIHTHIYILVFTEYPILTSASVGDIVQPRLLGQVYLVIPNPLEEIFLSGAGFFDNLSICALVTFAYNVTSI